MNVVYTKNAPDAIGPYSQAIITNGFVFTSGQIAINPESGLIEAHLDAGVGRIERHGLFNGHNHLNIVSGIDLLSADEAVECGIL